MIGLPAAEKGESASLLACFFPSLTSRQKARFEALQALYEEWNAKINVVSRKDIGHLYAHHVLHSLAIAKVLAFLPGSRILDAGTGGGFPGIPLAILFEEAEFHLVDSVGKKAKVAEAVADALELENVVVRQARVEALDSRYDFVVSRAVAPLPELYGWVGRQVSSKHRHALPNGILCLKGGDLRAEEAPFGKRVVEYAIPSLLDFSPEAIGKAWKEAPRPEREALSRSLSEYYESKKVVYVAF